MLVPKIRGDFCRFSLNNPLENCTWTHIKKGTNPEETSHYIRNR
jgi:hypothetical protein